MTFESMTAAVSCPRRRPGPAALIVIGVLIAAAASMTTALIGRAWRGVGDPAALDRGAATYRCPMHPSVVEDHPAGCPICGMKLVEAEHRSASTGNDALPVQDDDAAASVVSGLAAVEIDPARQQRIGLQTTDVVRGEIGAAWRTVGRVAIDETRVRHINLKVAGFVERIYVDFVGKKVRRGDPLFSLYSPELLAAQEKYLAALKTTATRSRPGEAVTDDSDIVVTAARRKLELWDVPAAEIARITRTGEPSKTLTFCSPFAGVVTRKDVVEGMRLEAGAMPYEIADLSSLWVLADVYESELRFVREGMTATLKLHAFPDRELEGRVVFLDPFLNAQTRTVKARLAFPNPDGELRPEMFGEVVLHGTPHRGLRIPSDAIIDSGIDKLVFVAVREGRFEPRKIEIGQSDGAHTEVVSGLLQGERVVSRANFLVDSESRLRASLADMAGATPQVPERARVLPATMGPRPSAPPPAGREHPP
jgi:Cu(I)/Ag(I) efflux system membrane fusion protein